MNRDTVISVTLALAAHLVGLFGFSIEKVSPRADAKPPAYVDVMLLESPPPLAAAAPPPEWPVEKAPSAPVPPMHPEETELKQLAANVAESEPVVAIKEDDLVQPVPVVPAPAAPIPVVSSNLPIEAAGQEGEAGGASEALTGSTTGSPDGITTEPEEGLSRSLIEPYFLKKVWPDYSQARRLGQEGLVTLMLYINIHGGLDKVELVQSSGYGLLDEAAITAAQRSRFRPAYQDQRPIACKAEVPYRFVLKKK